MLFEMYKILSGGPQNNWKSSGFFVGRLYWAEAWKQRRIVKAPNGILVYITLLCSKTTSFGETFIIWLCKLGNMEECMLCVVYRMIPISSPSPLGQFLVEQWFPIKKYFYWFPWNNNFHVSMVSSSADLWQFMLVNVIGDGCFTCSECPLILGLRLKEQ